jgi:excisionase family DNA binding protein
MAAADRPGHVPDRGEGVVIPAQLARLAAFLIEHGVNDLADRHGGAPYIRYLPELRKLLAIAASGKPSGILESSASAPSFTTAEAASVMRLSERMARHLAATGRLRATKERRNWLIDRQSAEDYRRERTR